MAEGLRVRSAGAHGLPYTQMVGIPPGTFTPVSPTGWRARGPLAGCAGPAAGFADPCTPHPHPRAREDPDPVGPWL